MPDTVELNVLLDRHPRRPESLLQVLREVQEVHNHIPPGIDAAIAEALAVPLARVRGVAGFYSFLSLEPQGRYRVLFSDNITDRMLGSREMMQALCGKLWLEPGKVSEDGLVSVATTSCTGMCDQGPALLVNGRAITRVTHQRINEIGELIRAGTPLAEWPAGFFRVDDHIRRRDLLLESDRMTGAALTAALERGPDAVIAELEASGLRGRGGAGFPTARKWAACRAAAGDERYVVCNADEGEPGTFKDRVLLASYADLVFEGMTVAALAIGARQGFLYLRGEYRYLLDALEDTLRQRRAAGLLGQGILGRAGFDFDIVIHLGAGAYVCGEESALIESLEGKRGIPRNRPPFPVTHGYRQRPTVVDNVETLCAAALIAMRGGAGYRAIGTPKSAGTKLLSVSGDCARPGIYEYPFGVSVRQVLNDCGASDALAVQISGPSGVCIGDAEFDRRIGFEDLATAGAFMVFDSSRDMFEVARNFVQFFAHESCGFCTPCRVGTSMQNALMDKIAHGMGTRHDLEELAKLDRVLQGASHCGLGHSACNPVLDTLKRFRPAYERRLQSLYFRPAFDLDGALAEARRMTGRDDAGAHIRGES
ncbi:MAG: NAD(P)H-dependent oxidoreductase subunit E [Gallionellaceae bacterium]|nr:NAD(P)H-dependent oxidoreductase subunit E [Gallionellaceae bacterium]